MIALLVHGEETLLDTPKNVNSKIEELLQAGTSTEAIEKREPVYCRSCSSPYFSDRDSLFCPCLDGDF
jgi:hypothetical protein